MLAAGSLCRGLLNKTYIPVIQHSRSRWQNKINLYLYPCLEERLNELDATRHDPELYKAVDIGLPPPPTPPRPHTITQRLKHVRNVRGNAELEKKARQRKLLVDLAEVELTYSVTMSRHHTHTLAQHYGIYTHLFGNAYFIPSVKLEVDYPYHDKIDDATTTTTTTTATTTTTTTTATTTATATTSPVYQGNIIKPREALCEPKVTYPSGPEDIWTLALTNPDGNLVQADTECLHWMVGNIRGSDVTTGEVLCDYLPPFPPRGSGYHRYVFVLYKQERIVDFTQHKRNLPCLSLKARTFSTREFYRGVQETLTPAGLAWFQSDWDASLTDFFHNVLKMREPVYEYDFPKVYVAPQKFFPIKRAFNTYLDLHRDPKEIQKELLLKRLNQLNPLEREASVTPYPNAIPIPHHLSSWQRREVKKERLGLGKYRDLYRGANRPTV
ncbi:hypothetical protein Pmani_040062 [Petrolisthes manimaculis]|uniref:Large ribosomal subunit protein mL38 n=1 Tax=Petrolisthes manimaculis TaxID=1843537 RepID=A0AAE1TKP5_9EUCA|nr:hypothetical protein Pmani_040062 [Petrolisthes manimaculis]